MYIGQQNKGLHILHNDGYIEIQHNCKKCNRYYNDKKFIITLFGCLYIKTNICKDCRRYK